MTPPKQLQQLTDQCVQCGLCLPHCPTFAESHDENRSPRGRIALIKALDQGQLPASQRLADHLNSCLSCRRCESACPRDVPYHDIISAGRRLLPQQRLPWLVKVISQQGLPARYLHMLCRVLQRLHIPHLLHYIPGIRRSPIAKHLTALPALSAWPQWQTSYPAKSQTRQRLLLLRGCSGDFFAAHTVKAAIAILNQLNHDVFLLPDEPCCGSLAHHQGLTNQDHRLSSQLTQSSQSLKLDAIISLEANCRRHLQEQEHAPPSLPVYDMLDFLQQYDLAAALDLQPCHEHLAYHKACSQSGPALESILKAIPDLKLTPLAGNSCCGAGGISHWFFPNQGQQLAQKLLAPLAAQNKISRLIISNLGCALHIQQYLTEHGPKNLQLQHPLMLLTEFSNSIINQ